MHISYRRVHNFSRFQLFLVDTDQTIKQSVSRPSVNDSSRCGDDTE
jgi:hypothetical protein